MDETNDRRLAREVLEAAYVVLDRLTAGQESRHRGVVSVVRIDLAVEALERLLDVGGSRNALLHRAVDQIGQ